MAVMALIFAIVQTGLWLHARHVALHAAGVGSTVASAEHAEDAAGATAAQSFVDQAGALQDAQVVVDRGTETVTVTVTGESPALVPGMPLPTITQSATAAIERWTG